MSTLERTVLFCEDVRSNVKTTELWSLNAGAIDVASHQLESAFLTTCDTYAAARS